MNEQTGEPAAVAALREWIPVSEREPEQSGEYLCVSNLGFGVHRFAAGMGVWSEHHGEDITHWMPLPNPPAIAAVSPPKESQP